MNNRSASSVGGSKSKYKIIFLGDQNTGKTSIIERFINNKFYEKANPTIGIDFLGKNVTYKGKNYRLQLWDTAGQERFRSLIPSYLKDAICVIYVFDLSNSESLRNLEVWTQLFKENKGPDTVSVICGNKQDLEPNFDQSKLKDFQSRHNLPFYQVSASTGFGVDEMFFSVIEQIGSLITKLAKTIEPPERPPMNPTTQVEPPLSSKPITIEPRLFPVAEPQKRCFCS